MTLDGSTSGRAPRWGAILGVIVALAAARTMGRWFGLATRRRGRRTSAWLRGGGLVAVGLAGTTLGVLVDQRSRRRRTPRALLVDRSVTIGRTQEELHRLLRAPGTLPLVTGGLAEMGSQGKAHWSVRAGHPGAIAWDTRIVEERSGQLLHWESAPGSHPRSGLSVRLRPAPRDLGTEVSLHLRVELDGSLLGFVGRRLRPVLTAATSNALHRFKSLAETGEVPALTGQPAARHEERDMIGAQS